MGIYRLELLDCELNKQFENVLYKRHCSIYKLICGK